MSIVLWISFWFAIVLAFIAGCAWLYGWFFPQKVLAKHAVRRWNFIPIEHPEQVAILIACHRGSATIGATVERALATGCDVYVVDDGSKGRKISDPPDAPLDQTTQVARKAGARVLELAVNVGKPAALFAAYRHFMLTKRYRAVAILDDDVMIEENFVIEALKLMTSEVAIVVGKNLTWWPTDRKWNIWLAKRAYSYWSYQLIIRRIQSFFGVMNCISGSNSLYRTELLDEVLVERTPYIVDDTFWVLETHRRKLGKIVYAPKARAHLQDPTTYREWYKQNLRWLWGTFQGVIGHRVGRSWSRFDAAYVLLMLQWLIYVGSAPVALTLLVVAMIKAPIALVIYLAGYGIWVVFAALQLRHPRLVLFIPAIIMADLVYRAIFVHALVKAIRQRTVENCVWESPTRIATV
ncbi:MAG: glycosyltransferase [Candidatus Saccharimonas sp.]